MSETPSRIVIACFIVAEANCALANRIARVALAEVK